jgi:glucoamylase
VDSFRFYNINKGIPQGEAVAVGRYSEDVYYNGNPWYLATLAAAEQLYDALYVWQKQGYIEVTDISSAFFKNLSPGIEPGTYEGGSETFQTLVQSVSSYADDFVNVVAKYTPQNGALAEQFSKDDGSPLSARDLTWSYASFLSASDRRAGIVPPSWANEDANNVPGTCTGGSARGSYESATATAFPPNQTPKDGTPTETTTPGCPTATEVAVTFRVKIETQFGDTIKLAGEAEDLGLWDPANAVPLDASEYTSSDPVWKTTINLPGGKRLLYKYINVGEDGSVTWEGDPNRMYTVPKTCDTSTTKSDTWQ